MGEYCDSNRHEHQQGCGCGSSCGCGCGSKHHHHHDSEEGGCHCAEKFLEIADEAWVELLKEKIKAKILAKKGEHVEKLAELIAMANGEKWENKIAAKIKCNKFKDNLKDFFSSSCE